VSLPLLGQQLGIYALKRIIALSLWVEMLANSSLKAGNSIYLLRRWRGRAPLPWKCFATAWWVASVLCSSNTKICFVEQATMSTDDDYCGYLCSSSERLGAQSTVERAVGSARNRFLRTHACEVIVAALKVHISRSRTYIHCLYSRFV
jgi:hypothetical protein